MTVALGNLTQELGKTGCKVHFVVSYFRLETKSICHMRIFSFSFSFLLLLFQSFSRVSLTPVISYICFFGHGSHGDRNASFHDFLENIFWKNRAERRCLQLLTLVLRSFKLRRHWLNLLKLTYFCNIDTSDFPVPSLLFWTRQACPGFLRLANVKFPTCILRKK